jgi:hypothetical protein
MSNAYIMKKGVSQLADLVDGGFASFAALKGVAGKIFYVDAGHPRTSDVNAGTDPGKPLTTIAAAYALCTADVGDVIYVSGERRYRETQLDILKDGIRIIGGGWGTEWNQNAAADKYVCRVMAKNVIISNIQISVNDQGGGIYVGDGGANYNAAMCLIDNCFIRGDWFTAAGPGASIGYGVYNYGASLMTVRNCHIWGWARGIHVQDGSDRTSYGCHIYDNFISHCLTYGIYWGGLGYTSVIKGNVIWDMNTAVDMTDAICLAESAGGIFVAGNYIGASGGVSDSGNLNFWVGNYIRATETASEALSVAQGAIDGTVT